MYEAGVCMRVACGGGVHVFMGGLCMRVACLRGWCV